MSENKTTNYNMKILVDVGLYGDTLEERRKQAVKISDQIRKLETDQLIRRAEVLETYSHGF